MVTVESKVSLKALEELEKEKLSEEIKQLRASGKTQWVTPAAIASLFPLFAALAVWVVSEIKQYNEAYSALAELDKLKSEKNLLQQQKDSLNIEVQTLLQLKSHYNDEVDRLREGIERKQNTIDHAYLKGVFASSETSYMLNHTYPMNNSGDTNYEELLGKIDNAILDPDLKAAIERMSQNFEFTEELIKSTLVSLAEFQNTMALMPTSEWTQTLTYAPVGSIVKGRSIMTSFSEKKSYYDVEEGNFLSEEEILLLKQR